MQRKLIGLMILPSFSAHLELYEKEDLFCVSAITFKFFIQRNLLADNILWL